MTEYHKSNVATINTTTSKYPKSGIRWPMDSGKWEGGVHITKCGLNDINQLLLH